jgi:hypothetical protein
MLSQEETEIFEALDGWLSQKKNWRDTANKVSILDMEPAERSQ